MKTVGIPSIITGALAEGMGTAADSYCDITGIPPPPHIQCPSRMFLFSPAIAFSEKAKLLT